jgi:hypothetical protein
MQKELDFLVHPLLSPIELRAYFLARELEIIEEEQRIHASDGSSTKVQELTHRIEHAPATPQLWASRGLYWLRNHQPAAAMSDFVRSLQCWNQIPEHSHSDKQQIQSVLKTMHNIDSALTQKIANKSESLKLLYIPILESLQTRV